MFIIGLNLANVYFIRYMVLRNDNMIMLFYLCTYIYLLTKRPATVYKLLTEEMWTMLNGSQTVIYGKYYVDTFYFRCSQFRPSHIRAISSISILTPQSLINIFEINFVSNVLYHFWISVNIKIVLLHICFPRLAEISSSVQFMLQNYGGILLMKRSFICILTTLQQLR